jgi:hypothetical protein
MGAPATLSPKYVELMNRVLGLNYYGEVFAIDLLARVLARDDGYAHRELLARQLLDETRHANLIRALLRSRGRDPLLADRRADFTYHRIFADFARRGSGHILALLGENESLSSRTFSQILRIARASGDAETASLYEEILNDEALHCRSLLRLVPDADDELRAARDEARSRMQEAISLRYVALFAAFPPPKGAASARAHPAKHGSGTTRWLRFLTSATREELRLVAALVEQSFAPGDGDPALREDLSAVLYVLTRHHDDIKHRVRERFGHPEREPAVEAELESPRGERDPVDGAAALTASVRARRVLCADGARVDPHTELLFRLHAAQLDEVVLPALERVACALQARDARMTPGDEGAVREAADAEIALLERTVERYRRHLPAFRLHPHDFLAGD